MSAELSKTDKRIEAAHQIIDLTSVGSTVPREEAKTRALAAANLLSTTGKVPDPVKRRLIGLGIKIDDLLV